MKKSFLPILYIFLAVFTVAVFYSVEIPPDLHWIVVFLPFFIPALLLIHLLFAPLLLLRRRYVLLLLNLVLLATGFKFYRRTFNFGFGNAEKYEGVKLFSYNVRVFNSYEEYNRDGESARKIINYSLNKSADIKCFQEFYYRPGSELFNTIKKFREKNPYYYFKPSAIVRHQEFGLAIFSKYPIVRKGEIHFPKATFNQAIYTDIRIGKDTLRVYNVHLQSMGIKENKLPEAKNTPENSGRMRELIMKIKRGASYRAGQVQALLDHFSECPYPIILAGDINDVPYSYTYEKLRERFNNAFEEKGFGFGFTHNGRLFFLRIDNIFSDERVHIHSFKTMHNVPYSDHFPIEIMFSL